MSRKPRKPHRSGLPRVDDSERAVVGTFWLGKEFAREVALRASADDFFLELERELAAHARELALRGEAIDASVLLSRLDTEERATQARELNLIEQSGLLVRGERSALDHLGRVRQAARDRRLLQCVELLPAILNNGFDPEGRAAALAEISRLCSPAASAEVLETMDVAAMLRDGVPEPTFDLDEFLLRRALTYLTGPPKGWKTLLALAWSVALESGRQFCGLPTSGDHRILFVEVESPTQIPGRFAKLCGGFGVDPTAALERIRFVAPRGALRLENPAHAQELMQAAAEFKATWVVIDSFVRVHSLNENDPGDMARLANTALLPLRDQAGCGVLVLDHPPKPFAGATRGKKEQVRGTWEKLAAADCQIHVETLETNAGKIAAVSVAASRLVPEREEPLYLRLRDIDDGGLAFEETEAPETGGVGRPPTAFERACNVISNELSRKRDLTFSEAMRFCTSAGIGRRTAAKAWKKLRPECKVQEVQK